MNCDSNSLSLVGEQKMGKYRLGSRMLSIARAVNSWGNGSRSIGSKAVLMVCTANICRSPMAEGIMRQRLVAQGLTDTLSVDSAGVHVFERGHRADVRAQKICFDRGVNLGKSRARQINIEDFAQYEHILVMDQANFQTLREMCPEQYRNKLTMMMDFAPEFGTVEVPDPYYSSIAGFETVFEMLEVAIDKFLRDVYGSNE